MPGVARSALIATAFAGALSVLAAVAPPAASPALPFLAAIDAPVALAADDLAVTTEARYVVAPAKGVVRVAVDVTVVNQKPERRTGRRRDPLLLRRRQPRASSSRRRHLRATQDGAPVRVSSSTRNELPPRHDRVPRRHLLRRDGAGPAPVRPAGRRAALGQRRPGRAGVRVVPRLGVRGSGERPDRRPEGLRRRRLGRGHGDPDDRDTSRC